MAANKLTALEPRMMWNVAVEVASKQEPTGPFALSRASRMLCDDRFASTVADEIAAHRQKFIGRRQKHMQEGFDLDNDERKSFEQMVERIAKMVKEGE